MHATCTYQPLYEAYEHATSIDVVHHIETEYSQENVQEIERESERKSEKWKVGFKGGDEKRFSLSMVVN